MNLKSTNFQILNETLIPSLLLGSQFIPPHSVTSSQVPGMKTDILFWYPQRYTEASSYCQYPQSRPK